MDVQIYYSLVTAGGAVSYGCGYVLPAGSTQMGAEEWDQAVSVARQPPPIDLTAYAADKRWRVETGGITVGGVPVATDGRSKTMIMGARIKADADSGYQVGWKGADGSFVQLTAPQIIVISDAVLAHVDACFTAEAEVSSAIVDGAVTTAQQIHDWSWPRY